MRRATARRRGASCRRCGGGPSVVSLLEPAHHPAQVGADLLDRMGSLAFATGEEVRPARLVLEDPGPGERAGLDVAEQTLHPFLHMLVNDLRARVVVAELGGIRDRMTHAGAPAFVVQGDDPVSLLAVSLV